MPFGKTFVHIFAISLQRHVDDRRHATPRRGNRASFKSVNCRSATKWQLHVRVHINATGHHVFASGVDNFVCRDLQRFRFSTLKQSKNLLALDQNIDVMSTSRADDGSVFNKCACHISSLLVDSSKTCN